MLDSDNLIAVCSKKLVDEPLHKKALFIRASSYLKKEMYQEAILDCNKIIEYDQNDPGAFYVRGQALERQG